MIFVPALKQEIKKSKKQTKMTTNRTALATREVAQFDELARQMVLNTGRTFCRQCRSIDPPNSSYFGYAEGKANVCKKGI